MSSTGLDPDRSRFLARRSRIGSSPVQAWPRSEKTLELVELETEWVRFSTLNHRTTAEQRKAARDRGREDLFTVDPLGCEAQEAQYEILCGQAKFADLKADLLDRKQQEPAIVTADGVLINGNRRTAALRSLLHEGERSGKYVKCLVLPQDATAEEILLLEAELQVAREFKEDYSWINEAMMIENLYELFEKSWDRVAAQMHRTVSDVRTQHEKLMLVHEIVDRSQGTLLHLDFTENDSAFTELARHIRNKPAREAEGIKSSYFVGILTDVNYRDLRHLQCDDAAELVEAELRREPVLQLAREANRLRVKPTDAEDDVLSDFLDGDEDAEAPLEDLLTLVLTRRRESAVALPDGRSISMESVAQLLATAVSCAAHEAAERNREQDTVQAPLKRVEKAIVELQRVSGILPRARAHVGWDEATFQDQLRKLEKLFEEIREQQ
ncbi:hypothetical protein TR51_28620 [Kitasatospora griseola]|uniref:ParB/Sulfiredoxin domain-containing protein n=1 Tax=Kitasatospora griseola TaxID=2064 RepID=A0A0D0PWA4_KITGR|nr:hypothetical protein [Kitasatospora griseola]KIQ62868.1 hypothetical protein TR51_28620 [Kitasatospora griseola]